MRSVLWLLAVVSLALFSCSDWRPSFGQFTNQAPVGVPDAVIKNFKTDYMSLNYKKWQLIADEAQVFNKDNRSMLSNLFLESYAEDKSVVNRVQSGHGIVYNESKNIELSNDVVIVTSNGTRVTGNYFFWNNATEQFTSPYFVRVVKPTGDSVSGVGFVGDRRIDKYTFKTGVSGNVESVKR